MITNIDKLFHIAYGQKEYHSKGWLDGSEGENILISAKGENNGVYGFFDIPIKFKAPLITVQGYGTIGHAFVQERDCAVDDHMLILIPKEKMSLEDLYQVAYQIRLTKWKYRYGRGITPDRLKYEKINLVKSKIDYSNLHRTLMPKPVAKKVVLKSPKMKLVPIGELCNITREYYLYVDQVDRTKEKVPYITTTEYDNGTGTFCNEDPIFKAGSLTVSLDGRSGLTFFQLTDYVAGEKTAVLTLKDIEQKSALIYIGMILRTYAWRFNYGRKLSIERLEKISIPMPMKGAEYDIAYMESLVLNSYGFDKIKEFVL
jgi:hypothetical protein